MQLPFSDDSADILGDVASIEMLAASVDRHVGKQIQRRRMMLGISQQQLATRIGVTYQQAHKYEQGLNRVSAGRLFAVARVLQVSVEWFFEGLTKPADNVDLPRHHMALELSRNFAVIEDEEHQLVLAQMARALASLSLLKSSRTRA